MAMSSFVRTFVALPMSRQAAEGFMAIQRELDAPLARIKWTLPTQFHITLKFIGDVDSREIPRVIEAVRGAVGSQSSLTLSFQGVGAFPDWRNPRVLWSRVADGASDLAGLAGAIRASLAWLGPAKPEKGFVPHVTLGRVKSPGSPELLRKAATECSHLRVGPEVVNRVVVYESRLSAHGAEHLELECVQLPPTDR